MKNVLGSHGENHLCDLWNKIGLKKKNHEKNHEKQHMQLKVHEYFMFLILECMWIDSEHRRDESSSTEMASDLARIVVLNASNAAGKPFSVIRTRSSASTGEEARASWSANSLIWLRYSSIDWEVLVRLVNWFFSWWMWLRDNVVNRFDRTCQTSALCWRCKTEEKITGVSVAVRQLNRCASFCFHCRNYGLTAAVLSAFVIVAGGEEWEPSTNPSKSVARYILWNWLLQMMKFEESSFTVMKELRFEMRRLRFEGRAFEVEEAIEED